MSDTLPTGWSALRRRVPIHLAISLLVVATYGGAVNRTFAGDQIRYFQELGNDLRLSSTLRLWDYTASRQYTKGDELLFRPLTGILCAVESSLFGYHYRAWNIAQLLLHVAVCLFLFELLVLLVPLRFATALAFLFSVLTANLELVVWNHLAGYLLG